MEFSSETVEAQVSLSSCRTPNQQTCIANEDIAIASEISTERSDVVEVEKTMVIQKKFVFSEKFVVPKASMTFPTNPVLYGNHVLCVDANASPICEGGFPNSQESGRMEVASQESLDSRMDVSSQGSHFSLMEYSSQEADVATEPAIDVCIADSRKVKSIKENCIAQSLKESRAIHHPHVLPKENFVEEIPIAQQPTFFQEGIPNNESDPLNAEGGISKINAEVYENYREGILNTEYGPLNAEGGISKINADVHENYGLGIPNNEYGPLNAEGSISKINSEVYETYGESIPNNEYSSYNADGGVSKINSEVYGQYGEDIPNNGYDLLNADCGISKINTEGYENYEACLDKKMGHFKRNHCDEEHYDNKLLVEKSLLLREEAVAAREAACMYREKAIKERETAPKRLKLISVFEC